MKTIIRNQARVTTSSLIVTLGLSIQPLLATNEAAFDANNSKNIEQSNVQDASKEIKISDNDILKFIIDEINGKGGILSKKIHAVFPGDDSCALVIRENEDEMFPLEKTVASFKGGSALEEESMTLHLKDSKAEEVAITSSFAVEFCDFKPVPSIDYLLDQGFTDFYLVGTNCNHSHEMNLILLEYLLARGVDISNIGGEIIKDRSGEVSAIGDFTPWGQRSFTKSIKNILAEGETKICVLSSFKKGDEEAFVKDLDSLDGEFNYPVLSFTSVEDVLTNLPRKKLTVEQVESSQTIAMSTVQSLESPMKEQFQNDLREWLVRSNENAESQEVGSITVTDHMVDVYNSVYLWKTAVEKADGFDGEKVIKELEQGLDFHGANGSVVSKVSRDVDVSIFTGSL